jgi:eukaryotic-like serine/threonine-protein kinase
VSVWDRLRRAFRPPPAESAPQSPSPATDAAAPPSDETYLRQMLARTADGDKVALAAIGEREFWGAIARLQAAGRERTAIELLGRFAVARPELYDLKARLVEILCDRREDVAARPLLDQLVVASPAHALRAHFLLSEVDERAGDADGARRHLESVLAADLDYPKARARADRLRRPAARKAEAQAAPTIGGVEGAAAFAGRYRLLRELGRGASGAVYVAHDEELDRGLAIKILHPHARAMKRAEARARAWAEARVAAAIRHPGVVAIYDLDEERQLLAMELCEGGALKSRLAAGALAPDEAVALAVELCAALAAVHAHGVAHGDVKPGNLLYRGGGDSDGGGGDLVLGDFGVARLVGERPVVDDRAARGTLGYMPPEQRRGEITPAADVYAAGVLLVEMLSGTAALVAWLGDRGALLRGEARWNGALPDGVRAALGDARTDALHALVTRMLADDPAARPTATNAHATLAAL